MKANSGLKKNRTKIQKDHISQYIILTLNINSVIFECCCINFDR